MPRDPLAQPEDRALLLGALVLLQVCQPLVGEVGNGDRLLAHIDAGILYNDGKRERFRPAGNDMVREHKCLLDSIREGKPVMEAIADSGVSRLRPVAMAALTTALGLIPLLLDAFFIAMAVTIMFGLGFATVLTLIFVPVLYATLFKIPYAKSA